MLLRVPRRMGVWDFRLQNDLTALLVHLHVIPVLAKDLYEFAARKDRAEASRQSHGFVPHQVQSDHRRKLVRLIEIEGAHDLLHVPA